MLSSSKNDGKQEARYSSRLDVLTERVDTLAATVATTASSTAKTDGELVGLRRDLQSAVARVEAAIAGATPGAGSAELNELTARVAALAAERPAQTDGTRLDDLNLMLLRLNERVEALAAVPAPDAAPAQEDLERLGARTEAALAEIRAHVAALAAPGTSALELRLDAFDARATELEERVAAEPAGVAAATPEVEQRLDAFEARAAALDERLAAQIAGAAAKTPKLEARLDGFEARATELDERLAARIADDEVAIPAVLQRLSAFDARVDALDERMAARIAEDAAKTPELEARLDGFEARATELDKRLAARTADYQTAMPALLEQLSAFEARVAALDERLGAQQQELASAQRQYAETGARIGQIVGELRPALAAIQAPRPQDSALVERVDELDASIALLACRLDTVESSATAAAPVEPGPTELGAGLEALESLAAELANASDLTTVNERLRLPRVDPQLDTSSNGAVAVEAGVVPLRSVEP